MTHRLAPTAPDHTLATPGHAEIRTLHADDVRTAAGPDLPADPDVPVGLYL